MSNNKLSRFLKWYWEMFNESAIVVGKYFFFWLNAAAIALTVVFIFAFVFGLGK